MDTDETQIELGVCRVDVSCGTNFDDALGRISRRCTQTPKGKTGTPRFRRNFLGGCEAPICAAVASQ
jgi:hypothetical protein